MAVAAVLATHFPDKIDVTFSDPTAFLESIPQGMLEEVLNAVLTGPKS
jgi:hypothetical protein